MRFSGRVYEDGKFWLAEVPVLDAMTQGRTREEALDMAGDLLESLANRPGFSITVHPGHGDDFEVSSPDTRLYLKACAEEDPTGHHAPHRLERGRASGERESARAGDRNEPRGALQGIIGGGQPHLRAGDAYHAVAGNAVADHGLTAVLTGFRTAVAAQAPARTHGDRLQRESWNRRYPRPRTHGRRPGHSSPSPAGLPSGSVSSSRAAVPTSSPSAAPQPK